MTKPKVGDRRPSTMCPPWCKEKGCYDEYQQMAGMSGPHDKNPKPYKTWVGRCKAIKKLSGSLGF